MPDCPLLDTIGGPEDVRALPPGKLTDLAKELRWRITEVVGERGGHLASGLGVVELTIALHRAFDFRHDRLVWDVGHQCYAHKLLTGRRERFGTLRTRGGVSGFPNPAESEYDLFVTGHASTSVSTALGLACAEGPSPASSAVKGVRRHVVAVVGDGAIGGGLAFEGLNHAGHLGLDLLVILNDNEMSIARSVGALSRHLSRVRLDPHYNELREGAAEALESYPLLGGLGKRLVEILRRAFTGGGIFQDLGFRYIGPVDGHDLGELEAALGSARDLRGPVLLHVYTQKGRGYGPAAFDPTRYHSAAPFKIRIESPREERRAEDKEGREGEESKDGEAGPPATYTDAMSRTLAEIGRKDERVVAITAAMADGTGLVECSRAWEGRCYDVGISEQHAVTFAAGLARGGKRPVVAIYSTFLQRAFESVFHDVCLQGDLNVTLLVDRAGLVGDDGPTHHGLYDIAFLRTLPNMVLAAPRDGDDLAALVKWAVDLGRPVAVRYPRARVPEPVGAPSDIRLGRGEILSEGERVAVVALGSMVAEAKRALDELASEGVKLTLVNARFAKPVDAELFARLAETHERIVTVEEGALAGGFGSAVLESAESNGWDAGKVTRLGVPDRFIEHATRAEQLAEVGLDAAGIAGALRRVAGERGA